MNTPQTHSATQTAMQDWLTRAVDATTPKLAIFDFDGTLTRRFANDAEHFRHARQHAQPILQSGLPASNALGGVCTSRAITEVIRVLDAAFVTASGKPLYGLSAAETGSTLFCQRLTEDQERLLTDAGFNLVRDPHLQDYSIFSLATISVDQLREQLIFDVALSLKIPEDKWSSSVHNKDDLQSLERLFQMSGHESIGETLASLVRYGSAYVKISGDKDDALAKHFVASLCSKAKDLGIFALVTPPMEGHNIWTVDFGAGVTKADAIDRMLTAYGLLVSRNHNEFAIAYFGDGKNDVPAYNYLASRSGPTCSFFVDKREGTNAELAAELPKNVVFLEHLPDIDGVAEGLSQFARV